MSSSLTVEERFEQLIKVNDEKDAQLEYLWRQLDQAMRNNRRELQSSRSTSVSHSADEESESNPFGTSKEDEVREPRRSQGGKQIYVDFKLEIPEFEGQLNADEFLDWMNGVRIQRYSR